MEQPVNPECKLSGTKYCRMLNMHACETCTIKGSDEMDRVMEDLDVYESLLPEGGISRLFTAKECQLCKGETKGGKKGYAIIDMAHPLPKRVQKWLLGKRTLKIGTMIPVQLAICPACRRRYMLMEYLPVICPVILGILGLILLSLNGVSTPLSNISSVMPLIAWILLILVGVLLGKLLAKTVGKRNADKMYVDALEHPVLKEMVEKGWAPMSKQSHTKLLFSKSRLARGMGTAVDEGEEAQQER